MHAIPGGYEGYLESFRWMATSIGNQQVPRAELETRIMRRFDITPSYAYYVVCFLLKTHFFHIRSGSCVLSDVAASWVTSRDDASLMALLHHKVQFIGECLSLLAAPMTVPDLRHEADDLYSMGWQCDQQINTRRGWLQSAGLMGCTHDGRLFRTDAGTAFLGLVEVEPPLGGQATL